MEELVPSFIEYGVLGLWTVSLMLRERQTEARHQSQMDKLEERHVAQTRDFLAMRDKIQNDVLEELQDNGNKLDRALDKINEGLLAMREKYAEDRMRDMAARTGGGGEDK